MAYLDLTHNKTIHTITESCHSLYDNINYVTGFAKGSYIYMHPIFDFNAM